ncbi:Protein of unknown function (DUF3738) [Terriglobus roseus DSM 18391]|uniref:Soil-associated protein, TIGR03435 family n=1 Tax=Terriglobus roseus (strain DSM 18391 / NRRL B-41598 / KBS 63) TaxID=926566 RepID=I3ZMR5_TERRK|nr:TIGR03435 family protein [Terriglobus roseus]AFL90533.1 Protein of unknown function (DUF3738) [Terriglobus roseus DSM 18391]
MALVWKRRLSRSVVVCLLTASVPCVGVLLPQLAVAQAASATKTDIVDSWQGTVHLGRDLRMVLKIEKQPNGTLKTQIFNADQGAQPIPVKSTSYAGNALKLGVDVMDATIDVKMSSDGTTLTGTLTRGDNPAGPVVFVRATPETAWNIPAPPARVPPMDPKADPTFEIATVKPSDPNTQGKGIRVTGRRFFTINTTLAEVIAFAYDVQQKQIVGAPAWVSTDKFDLNATPDVEGQPNDVQLKNMIKKLVADRFALKFHPDKHEMAAYVLSAGPGVPKLERNTSGGTLPGLFFTGVGKLRVTNATMTDFTSMIQNSVFDRPVVNKTGLEGRWDFVLKWTPDETQFPGAPASMRSPPPPTDGVELPPTIYKAVQEQLGLKLDSTKTKVDVMVLDHVEKPSEN